MEMAILRFQLATEKLEAAVLCRALAACLAQRQRMDARAGDLCALISLSTPTATIKQR